LAAQVPFKFLLTTVFTEYLI